MEQRDLLPDTAVAAAASERIGWRVILSGSGANRVVSPSSLVLSLALAAEGARGASLASIDDVLGLSGEARAAAFGALRGHLLPYDALPAKVNANDPPKTPVVHQAAQVVALGGDLKPAFAERAARFFGASVERVPLTRAKAALDAWVRRHTAGLIRQSPVQPDASMGAVLQDAVLFAASWRFPFPIGKRIGFQGAHGADWVDGVSGQSHFTYAEGARWSAVRLAYDGNLAADVILPRPGLAAQELRADDLTAASAALVAAVPGPVVVTMPTFDLMANVDVMQALPEVDLRDLSGMFDDAFVGAWLQQAKLIVTARGTVGAAVTAMALRLALPPPVPPRTFTVDRPYVFRVVDTRTSWPLFLALIADPGEN